MSQKENVPTWAKSSNVYEVNLRQYTPEGTFKSFEKELPRLRDMGVDILWFMPIYPISITKRLGILGSYYAISNYQETNPEFGSFDDYKRLVALAHESGFKVIIDWVANHTGWDHHWTLEHPEFYKKDTLGNFHDSHGWEDVIDLDYSNARLRTAMIAAMQFWIKECDIDGFRCDMAHLVPLDFWQTARFEMNLLKKELFWLGETEDVVFHLAFDATYAWELLHTMERLFKGSAQIPDLDNVLQKYATRFPPASIHLAFTSNHDENSHSGSEYERLGEAARVFAVLTATWTNCMPLVYSGQELPNRKRLKFFEKDEIEWTGTYWLHDFYRSLLMLHKENKALYVGEANAFAKRIKTSADYNIFAFARQREGNEVIVILNLSSSPLRNVTLDNFVLDGKYKNAFSGLEYDFTGLNSFEIGAWDYLVYYRDGK